MPKTRALIGDRGTTFTRSFVTYSLCCPSRSTLYTGQYAHNHGVLSNKLPTGGFTRARHVATGCRSGSRRPAIARSHVGKFLNGYGGTRRRRCRPGWNEWNGLGGPVDLHATTATRSTRTACCAPTRASTRPTSSPSAADELIAAASPAAQPWFMSVAFLGAALGRPARARRPARPRDAGGPRPSTPTCSRRCRCPKPASFNEADVSDKPRGDPRPSALRPGRDRRDPARPTSSGSRALLAVDDGMASIIAGLRATRRARQHADPVHERQRVLSRRAPRPDGQGARLRAVDPGAAADARAGRPARRHAATSW